MSKFELISIQLKTGSVGLSADANPVLVAVLAVVPATSFQSDECHQSKPKGKRSSWQRKIRVSQGQLPLLPDEPTQQPKCPKVEPVFQSDSFANVIREVAEVAQLPVLPHHWVRLIEQKRPEEVRLALEAFIEYSRYKKVRDVQATVWSAIDAGWKPNKRQCQS